MSSKIPVLTKAHAANTELLDVRHALSRLNNRPVSRTHEEMVGSQQQQLILTSHMTLLPVMNPLASLARNTASPFNSAGLPNRPIGVTAVLPNSTNSIISARPQKPRVTQKIIGKEKGPDKPTKVSSAPLTTPPGSAPYPYIPDRSYCSGSRAGPIPRLGSCIAGSRRLWTRCRRIVAAGGGRGRRRWRRGR